MYESHHNWAWMFTVGCLLVVLGALAIAYSMAATVVSVMFLGWILVIGGILEGIHAFQHRESGHLFLYVVESLLAIVAGALLLKSPEIGALVVTLLLATYFVVAGIFRIAAAVALRFPTWGWMLFNGLVSLALGIIVWGGWPATGFWVLGVFVGISLMVSGWVRMMLALALRSGRLQAIFAH